MYKVIVFLFIIIICYGVYNAQKKEKKKLSKKNQMCEVCETDFDKLSFLRSELLHINSYSYLKKYIIDVINHGSSGLGFKGGIMEGGYVSKQDAPKIACYVIELSGRRCDKAYPKDAQMFYTSVCGGCHGNDGRGLGGNYPDLTRKKLLGIEKREEFLKMKIKELSLKKERHKNKIP